MFLFTLRIFFLERLRPRRLAPEVPDLHDLLASPIEWSDFDLADLARDFERDLTRFLTELLRFLSDFLREL